MAFFYEMTSRLYEPGYSGIIEEKVPSELRNACADSEFQKIPRGNITLEAYDDSKGFADFYMCCGCIPLISGRVKALFEKMGVTNGELLYRTVTLHSETETQFYLALPQRIDCLDKSRTQLNPMGRAEKLVITENNVGYFNVFKVRGIVNNNIIVSEKLMDALTKANFIGFDFPNKIN